MTSKGKKTEHVIQETGEMKMSEAEYAVLVASGVTRPCLPHEIELKHLSKEKIAQGDWTLKQMFDYLAYMKDFCGMPDSEPSIYIPIEYSHMTKYRITCNFRAQKFGEVRKVGLVSHCNKSCDDCNGKMFNKVFVHFKVWNTYYTDPPGTTHLDVSTIEQAIDDFITKNERAIRVRFALITGKTIKLHYDEFDKVGFVKFVALRPEHFDSLKHE